MATNIPRNDIDYVRTHLMRSPGKTEIYYFMLAEFGLSLGSYGIQRKCVFASFFVDISDEVKMMVAMDLALDCYNIYGVWPALLPPEYRLQNFNP